MSALITLREAGIDYPDMVALQTVRQRLCGDGSYHVPFYGGYLRDLVLLGDARKAGDLDVAMSIDHFLALKPKDKEQPDWRRSFVLHEPHLLFMLHQMADGALEGNPKPMVLALKPEHAVDWGLGVPVGLNLTRKPADFVSVIADCDLAFSEIVSNGEEIWVTRDFLRDRDQFTITMKRCRDTLDYVRTMRRMGRFMGDRYRGWLPKVPEEFRQFEPQT